MCGICGWIRPAGIDLSTVVNMNRLASHRGPDGEGYWLCDGNHENGQWFTNSDISAHLSDKGMIGLGHRRLAIIDLSNAGLQPMTYYDRQHWIVFNGEIYNYVELREELRLAGYYFTTETDTEVILAAYRQWGCACFQRFNGMWGLAIVDLEKSKLVLSRDRLGVKPLYYWLSSDSFAFASEIKQFYALPGFCPRANLNVLCEYIETGYEIPPETFFRDVQAFPPACVAEIPIHRLSEPQPNAFWGINQLKPLPLKQADRLEQVRFLFEDAVRIRLRSDVPVGVCLSGGLDSSLIYGQIQSLVKQPSSTHAFSASYKEKYFDESVFIEKVIAKHGGNVHYTFPDAWSFVKDFKSFVYQHDEPPGAISQYAAWDVMRLARQNQVPVLLNGQGGDELFSGYWPAYYLFLQHQLKHSPRKMAAHMLGALLPGGNGELIRQIPAHLRQYFVRKDRSNFRFLARSGNAKLGNNWANYVQRLYPEQYRWSEVSRVHLPRLLKWDDRNSMAFGIEGRYPFLDYRLVEYMMQVPVEENLHAGWNKYLLRMGLGHLLPIEVQWRRDKVGFVTPQSIWFQTTLNPVFRNWIEKPSLKLLEFIDHDKLKSFGYALLSQKRLHPMNESQHLLFRLFALDTWLERYNICL